MPNQTYPYQDMGDRLKKIREQLDYTLDTISEASNVSRSYISEFERGSKLPSNKYLLFLFENHDIDINYVFGAEGTMTRSSINEIRKFLNFGRYQGDIAEMLSLMLDVPHALYAALCFFTEYKVNHAEFLQRHADLKKKESEKTVTQSQPNDLKNQKQ